MSEAAAADARLTAYTELLARYNGALNLVSAQGLRDVDRLVADGKAYARLIAELAGPTATVVDVGSGAGFPGIVIAVSLPRATVYLVERRRRRAAFLELAVGSLGVSNATVHPRDVRSLAGVCADVVTAQAVTTMSDLTRITRHVHRDPSFLISRRGPGWREDLAQVREALAALQSDGAGPIQVPVDHPSAGIESPSSAAEEVAAVTVAAVEDLDQSGSLVALRLTGGPACRSSG